MKKIKITGVNKFKLYGETMITQWLLVCIIMSYWILTKRSFHSLLYFKSPIGSFGINAQFLWSFGLGIVLCVGVFALLICLSKTIRLRIINLLTDESIQFLLPSTLGERLYFLFIAITAGVCEEFIFRGVMVYYLIHFPVQLSLIVIGIISSLLFGIVHLYQGFKGVLMTAYLGGVLVILFIGTGTLWVPIILHVLIDAKFVFLPNRKISQQTSKGIEENLL